ncbi:hypothetical protein GCM10010885_10280 [Alicyclobacillus cellulosilyticus]|uniref:Calcineurin-like phosphoesterase domain-containing protein n=1 Tax=Alicyclobacillus cellulosilyticus TaxID=1003997 RepID=A0A917K9Q9_9BACL|nr:metallophosphoesterase [Alicyclobacillus cellulosilyticus]GGJ02951.1 hypothetical protein GCM10010885_10280 [Alicyclobacillus cellulosilyticus]
MRHSHARIAVFSDMHFMAWQDTLAPVEWVEQLEADLADTAALVPQLFVCNGDLTNGKARDYELAMRTIRRHLPHTPCVFTMGNHEYYGYYEDVPFDWDLAQHRFLQYTGMPGLHQVQQRFGLTLIFLSTEGYQPDWHDAGFLTQQTLAWFEAQLHASSPGPVLVWFHQPIDGTVAKSEHTCLVSEALRTILARRPGTVFISGHTHCPMDRDDQFIVDGTTLFVGGGCAFGDAPQSRWIEIADGTLTFRIRDHASRSWLAPWTKIARWENGRWHVV